MVQRMSAEGQKRRFERPLVTSGFPRQADIRGVRRYVSKVPRAAIEPQLESLLLAVAAARRD